MFVLKLVFFKKKSKIRSKKNRFKKKGWRRQNVQPQFLRDEIVPKNMLMYAKKKEKFLQFIKNVFCFLENSVFF